MRIELKDENQEEPQKIDENDICYKHETDLTKKEKRELEKMKLASMGWKGKLQYIWAYYKPQMAAIVAVIAIPEVPRMEIPPVIPSLGLKVFLPISTPSGTEITTFSPPS